MKSSPTTGEPQHQEDGTADQIDGNKDEANTKNNGSVKVKLGVGRPTWRRDGNNKRRESEEIGNDDQDSNKPPKMKELRGKSQSLSRRGRSNTQDSTNEGSPNSPRKNYRRLYVTKVRNSKVYDADFNINSEAAKIMQRVDQDVLQIELKLKSTDLKLLP